MQETTETGPPTEPGVDQPRSTGSGLVIDDVSVVYGKSVTALRGVSLSLPPGQIVAVMGVNGAGKSTLARTVSGLLGYHRGRLATGRLTYDGHDVGRMSPRDIVRAGISQSLEGRRVFADLDVADNLRVGGVTRRRNQALKDREEWVLSLFPRLAERSKQLAGLLSGGEQQMLALGRALMQSPTLLVLDEPSLGLAPKIVEQIAETIGIIRDAGTSVLLIEQNATMALTVADHGHVLAHGRVVREGPAAQLLADPDIQRFYLGLPEDQAAVAEETQP